MRCFDNNWFNALRAAAEKLDPQQDSVLLFRIREYTAPKARATIGNPPTAGALVVTPVTDDEEEPESSATEREMPAAQGNIYGDFINFRGLQHAPVNEQGVVFLFGMICHELGYVDEIVKTGFPDCVAKRRVGSGRWQLVRIEFEFKSRNFKSHGHDPNQCDVIVCWEHNWANCPVDVLELKSALPRLPSTL